ncbi:MAG TPA: 1-acyl-sn-glycerol-3-phosphate acyltransferase [Thermoanaerobaculia bacterium]|nr:1-acyl-sn-glycerol-3-phosphate acyltransferase [Thermoanaerobaculia bacterium]
MSSRNESLLSIWARRAVTIPLYFLLAVLAFVTAPLWTTAGFAWDALAGAARRRPRTRALAFFALYLVCEAAGLLAAALLWIVTLGGRIGGPGRWIELNATLQRRWADTLFFGSLRIFSMKVSTEGLELARSGPFLLFVRHASMADTVLAAAFVANPNRLLLRYVLKRELLWDPCLDVVGRRLPNAFVNRRGPGLDAEVAAVAGLASGLDARSAVLIYPEGKRFSEPRRAAALAALREKGLDDLAAIADDFRYVLAPRLRGPLALLDAARGVDVVLLEHTGFEGASSFAEFRKGALVGGTLRVRLRRIPAATIPAEGRDRWLYERWAEMDRWISESQAARAVQAVDSAGRSDA